MSSTNNLNEKPLVMLSCGELVSLIRETMYESQGQSMKEGHPAAGCKYVYGIKGIADLFGCSVPTANKIKRSGKIDKAITQVGRKIVVDAEMALELAGCNTQK